MYGMQMSECSPIIRPCARTRAISSIDDRVVGEVRARAAVLGGSVGAEKSRRAHLAPALAIAHPGAIPSVDLGHDLVVDELRDLGPEHLVLLGENVSAHAFLLGLRENPCTDRSRVPMHYNGRASHRWNAKTPISRAKCNTEL